MVGDQVGTKKDNLCVWQSCRFEISVKTKMRVDTSSTASASRSPLDSPVFRAFSYCPGSQPEMLIHRAPCQPRPKSCAHECSSQAVIELTETAFIFPSLSLTAGTDISAGRKRSTIRRITSLLHRVISPQP